MIELVSPRRIIGVELEYEGVHTGTSEALLMEANSLDAWALHEDHSLRPSNKNTEFVLRTPLPYAHTVDLLRRLHQHIDYFNRRHASDEEEYSTSWRCGFHMHVDYRQRDPQEVTNLLILFSFLDPMIFAWEGNGRQESKFCIPVQNYDLLVSDQVASRYGSVNVLALGRHGSVEFRHPQTSFDTDVHVRYMNIVLSLCALASQYTHKSYDLLQSLCTTDNMFQWVHEAALPPTVKEDLLSSRYSQPYLVLPTSAASVAAVKYYSSPTLLANLMRS